MRIERLEQLIEKFGAEKVAEVMGVTETHIHRNLLTGKSQINLVKLAAAERRFQNKS